MSNEVTLSRKRVRRVLRVQHPDWTGILHDVKKAYLTTAIPLSFYDQFHRQLSTLLEKRPREDGDDDEDEEEREEQAKRPRTDDDETGISNIPVDMLFEIFAAMPWYHIYAARRISQKIRTIIDTRVLRTIREITIDDEDPNQKATGYNFPEMLTALMENPAMPRNILTKLNVSRIVFPAGYTIGSSDPKEMDPYNNIVWSVMSLHQSSMREVSLRGVSIARIEDAPTRVIVSFPDFSSLRVIDIKPFTDWTGTDSWNVAYIALLQKLAKSRMLKELRVPYITATARINIMSMDWSVFPTAPSGTAKGFATAVIDDETKNAWRFGGVSRGHYIQMSDRAYGRITNKSVEHIHFYSPDTAFSVIRNVNVLYRSLVNKPPRRVFTNFPSIQYLPDQGTIFPDARSVMFDGPYYVWNKTPQRLRLGDKCKLVTGVANFWAIQETTPIAVKLQRVCVFDSFSRDWVEPHKELSVTAITDRCPSISQLFVQRSQTFAGPEDGGRAGTTGNNLKLYHVGPIPIEAMKNVEYDLFRELRAATHHSEGNPYPVDINEESRIGFETMTRSYAPYFAVGNFANLERVSFWWTDKSERDRGMPNPETMDSMLENLEALSTICIVDGNELFSKIIAAIGHIKYDFTLLQSTVKPLPRTIDDANMRTQRCYLWPVDDDMIRTMVDIDDIHPDTRINGRYVREWIDQMDVVPY